MYKKVPFTLPDRPVRILALDVSTKTGYSVFEGSTLKDKGLLRIDITHMGINGNPDKHPDYPYNFLNASAEMVGLIQRLVRAENPDTIVIENTVLSRNRHAQRLLEFIHRDTMEMLFHANRHFHYLNPSEWRKILEMRMTPEDKAHNKAVKEGKATGKITPKHLSVRFANNVFGLSLLQKDNDVADAVNLGYAYHKYLNQKTTS